MSGGRHGFADGNPVVVHVGGELRGSLCLTRLGQNQIGVRICFHIEVDDQPFVFELPVAFSEYM